MNIGISTGCFFPRNPDESLKAIGMLGAKSTEVFFNTDSQLNESYLYNLKNIAEQYGIRVISVHPFTSAIETFMFWAKTEHKLEDSIIYYEKYFRACQILGAQYVVIHGCHDWAEYMSMEKYTQIFNLISRKAREYGVYVCQENVVKYKCGYIENLHKFRQYADEDVKFVFDIKQAVRAKQDIYEMVDLMGDRISHIHISDFTMEENSLLPGTGNFDYKKLFEYVSEKYGVNDILIEVYKENIPEEDSLVDSLELLKNII